uniref:Copia protein n=1 Tax=Tanacetum cinerariifolium TaxID=118510 RepID=A0A6L2MA05_TANCI|nr:copia protein [Tanacetum cinerariifolium]
MSTRSSAKNLFPPLDNPKLTIRRRSHTGPTLLNDSEMAVEGNGDLPVPDLQTMEELYTFYNGLTLRHRDTINAAAGGTFMKRRPEDCYDLIENITAYHNDWDTSTQWTTVGNTQNAYAAGSYQVVKRGTEVTKDMVHPTNNGSTKDVQPLVVPTESLILNSELIISPIIEPVSASKPNLRPLIPYPSRLHDQKLRDKANDQREKFFQIFKDLNFNISFADALILMPKFGPSIKSLLTNKDKLSLADLGASINLMPLSVWNKLVLPDLSPICMTLELANHLISRPVGVAEDVYVKVGTFHFPVDFVVVDFDADPRVPLILRRSFLKTERDLIDVFEAVKRIFRYLKDTIHMGLWYPKDTGFELTAFSDSDHARCLDSRKSTSGGIQFLGGDKLVSWSSKKQDCTSMSFAEAEYVSLSACCAQVLWMRTQLRDYGFHFDKIPMYYDSKAAIAISCNLVHRSRTKHIDVRYHFIKEKVEKGIVELFFVETEYQLADLFTKALPEERFKYLVRRLGMRCLTPKELEVLENEFA